MKYFSILFFFFSALSANLPTLLPEAINKGDLFAIVFPASFLDDSKQAQEVVNRKVKWLQKQGYRTVLYPTKVNIHGYLAGSDQERAKALMNAWKNSEVKAIWCFRGGWGSPRILNLLDYEWIADHPKVFIGMSDITALHQAIQHRTGLVTFLAPVLNYFDDAGDFDDEYAFKAFEQIVVNKKKGTIALHANNNLKVIHGGKAKGKLVGGNLTLIASLCGTEWQINTDGKILLLEDVGEEIYRIDRYLWQLKEAGLLDKPAAVILGSWVNCKSAMQNSLTLEQVFAHYFKNADYPVISGFPTGHDKVQTTMPLNTLAEIDTEQLTVKLLQSAVQ